MRLRKSRTRLFLFLFSVSFWLIYRIVIFLLVNKLTDWLSFLLTVVFCVDIRDLGAL